MSNTTQLYTQEPKTQHEALKILVSALNLAQSRGAFHLSESSQIVAALRLFQPAEPSEDSVMAEKSDSS